MAGKTVRVLEKTLFANLLDNVAANASVKTWVATNVDISGYLYGCLVLRVHSWPTATGAPTIALSAFGSAPTSEDPASTFRGPVVIDGQTNGKIAFSATVAPTITTVGVNFSSLGAGAGAPGFVDILLTVTQGATANSPTVFTVSGDLVLRS